MYRWLRWGDSLEDRMVYDTAFTVTFLREHTLLKKLLRPTLDETRTYVGRYLLPAVTAAI
jgi:hypothetical protein